MHYISELIRAATLEIYASMVNTTATVIESDDTVITPIKPGGLTASIQFTGGWEAWLHMTYDEELAKNVTFTMMGTMPASLLASEVGDVLGELANMIAGSFKGKMAVKGLFGAISVPQISRNESLGMAPFAGGVQLMNRIQVPVARTELEIRILAKV